jgi:hypothetical protein
MGGAIAFALEALSALPALIGDASQAISVIHNATAAIKAMEASGTGPTDAQWAELNAEIATALATIAP